jgi:DeoR/GlpR family transcriptional regulator of sugar metabolism
VTTSLTFRVGDAGMGERRLEQIIGSCPALEAVLGGGPMREIAKISLDRFVLCACSIDAERGIGAFDFENAQMKAALIEGAGSTVLAVQNKKLGRVATHRIAAINVIADIVVEADASPSMTELLWSKDTGTLRKTGSLGNGG